MIQKVGSIGSTVGPLLVDRILTNSQAMAVGDSVKTVVGFLTRGTVGARVLGHVESLVGKDGLTPVKDGTYLGNIGETYTASASNQTVALVSARVDVSTDALYTCELSQAAGTTTGSNLAGKYFNLTDQDTLNETTVTETRMTLTEGTPNTVTMMQYYSHGLDRNLTTQVIANIVFSEVFGF